MFSSPQIRRTNGFKFVMYFNEGGEPPHVHVFKGEHGAKFWLQPVKLCDHDGFNPAQLKFIRNMLIAEQALFLEEWHAIQAQNV